MIDITLSSHVLDLDTGRPATHMKVVLEQNGQLLQEAHTDEDGRVSGWSISIEEGHSLTMQFSTEAWFAERGSTCFYPSVSIDFRPAEPCHFHIPLLINRHGYSTYRGS